MLLEINDQAFRDHVRSEVKALMARDIKNEIQALIRATFIEEGETRVKKFMDSVLDASSGWSTKDTLRKEMIAHFVGKLDEAKIIQLLGIEEKVNSKISQAINYYVDSHMKKYLESGAGREMIEKMLEEQVSKIVKEKLFK